MTKAKEEARDSAANRSAGKRHAFAQLMMPCLFLALAAASIAQPAAAPKAPAPKSPYPAEWLNLAKKSRNDLLGFYSRTFPAWVASEGHAREIPLNRLSHLAHRLWIEEEDPTREKALSELGALVRTDEAELRARGADAKVVPVAYFDDAAQLHRDQYALIMSEMGIEKMGGRPLVEFISGARLDFGSKLFSARGDKPWTAALLARATPPGKSWPAASGKLVSMKDVLDDMLAAPFPTPGEDPFACYDYHVVYALAVAVERGYADYAAAARDRFAEALSFAGDRCAASRARGDAMDEVVGRIKLNGHLMEAFFRGGPEAFAPADYRVQMDAVLRELAADARVLAAVRTYQGTPNVFVAVPHALHGGTLAIARMSR